MTFLTWIQKKLYSWTCNNLKPKKPFSFYELPCKPDYSDLKYWAAHPDRMNDSWRVPKKSNLKCDQLNSKVDVFFVHPTTIMEKKSWNADCLYTNKFKYFNPIKLQASIFNESAKVYAPRYRQAIIYAFIDKTENGKKALDLAYSDVKSAFQYYMKNFNNGRPFILAGHSQGSLMCLRLMQEFIDGKNEKKFICAYLPGQIIKKTDFKSIRPSQSPIDIGCYAVWNTKKWGIQIDDLPQEVYKYSNSVCINPISWKEDENIYARNNHLGGVSWNFKKIDHNMVDCKCENEMLWVKNVKSSYKTPFEFKHYHCSDYSLFYMDIRKNVKERIDAYFNYKSKLNKQKKSFAYN